MPGCITRLDPIDVMYVSEFEKPDEEAFAELEAVVGLKGRRFYGVFDEDGRRYWACVQRREQDDPASLGLRSCTIGGGLYASKRLRGDYEDLIALIAPTFEEMGRTAWCRLLKTSHRVLSPARRVRALPSYCRTVGSQGGRGEIVGRDSAQRDRCHP